MSMLTPPGMGGKYRITGDKYPRMRRPRRRLAAAVTGSALAVGLIGWGTAQLIEVFSGDGTRSATVAKAACKPSKASPTPPPASQSLPRPAQIKVNVYNATPRSGLAKAAADELKKRGFAIGQVGNAPELYDKKIAGTGILLGPPKATQGAFSVLGTQLAGAQQKIDARETGDVDLILGTAYKALSKKEDADRALAALANPAPAPSPKC
ncbi:LytR C-terminal domain-containing protein [Streptomyces sp. A3M-1-3]|uniref:LytR C-terminal domain-containing protein n=1 Tax=Streptomyces sp. A3M-1-3 TaxID=2962044 RepID=UPI0020B8CC47|nr:LytR C-terminal domain-containing protein [Streptomyces sp. A3M-1-3]MCP3818003.1 LytR C-terminal domain-containing protein [Streptomyces sp. A3M-1-3]